MDPILFVKECCDPGYPLGYINLMIEDQAVGEGWSADQMQTAKDYALERYNQGARFQFPAKVRYV
jgi:hypothetical protein